MATVPNQWSNVNRAIEFEFNNPTKAFNSVSAGTGGKARINLTVAFTNFNDATRVYVNGAVYSGYYDVVAMTTAYIEIDTPFTVTDSGDVMIIFEGWQVKLSYGYPTQSKNYTIDLIHDPEGNLKLDVSEWLQPTFRVVAPVPGIDTNLFTHYKIELIQTNVNGFADYLTDESTNREDVTGVDESTIYYACNATMSQAELQTYVNNGKLLNYNGKAQCFTGASYWYTYIMDDVIINAWVDEEGNITDEPV